MVAMIILSQCMSKIRLPCYLCSRKGCEKHKFPIFKMFPVCMSNAFIKVFRIFFKKFFLTQVLFFNKLDYVHFQFNIHKVILAIILLWILCYLLTVTEVLPKDPSSYGYYARTDIRISSILASPWFRVPYPGLKLFRKIWLLKNRCLTAYLLTCFC